MGDSSQTNTSEGQIYDVFSSTEEKPEVTNEGHRIFEVVTYPQTNVIDHLLAANSQMVTFAGMAIVIVVSAAIAVTSRKSNKWKDDWRKYGG